MHLSGLPDYAGAAGARRGPPAASGRHPSRAVTAAASSYQQLVCFICVLSAKKLLILRWDRFLCRFSC